MKKSHFFTYLTFSVLTLFIRYPRFDYITGTDTFDNIVSCNKILNYGFNPSFISIFSYFGLYPFSTNMGGASILASVSLLTDLSPASGSLFVMIIFGYISFNGAIMLGRILGQNIFFSIIFGAIFSMSSLSVDYTTWSFSYRGLFLSLLPIYLFLMLQIIDIFNKRGLETKRISLLILLVAILISIHRVSFFLPLLILIFVIVTLLFKFYYLAIHTFSFNSSNHLLPVLITILYLIPVFSGSNYFKQGEYADYGLYLFDYESVNFIINTAFAYAIAIGLPGIFFVPGLFYMFYRSNINSITNSSVVILILSFFPYWTDVTYAIIYLLLLVSYISTLGLFFFFKEKRLKPYNFTIPLIVIVLIASPLYFVFMETEPDNVYLKWTKEEEIPKAHNAGIYLSEKSNIGLISDGTVSMSKIAALAPYNENISVGRSGIAPYFADQEVETVDLYDLLTAQDDYLFVHPVRTSLQYSILGSSEVYDSPTIQLQFRTWLDDRGKYNMVFYHLHSEPNCKLRFCDDSSVFTQSVISQTYETYNNGFHSVHHINYN